MKKRLYSPEDLLDAVEESGFLPFFRNEIPGFSVEELCPLELWFAEGVDGPWEWKGPAAKSGRCIYGKFFRKKAGFVSREWMPDFVNLRRNGYDFDARYDDGLAPYQDKELYETLIAQGAILSSGLKRLSGSPSGFDTSITRLQMQSYVCIGDFIYRKDKFGRPYGWGIAQYTTPEHLFGYDLVTSAYDRSPEESGARILAHLSSLLPTATEKQLSKILNG